VSATTTAWEDSIPTAAASTATSSTPRRRTPTMSEDELLDERLRDWLMTTIAEIEEMADL
jgi:hypothetical protein